MVRILSTLDREKLKLSSSIALHRQFNSLVDILLPEADSCIAVLGSHEKPDVTYADVGGLDMQKQEIRETMELPLTHFDLYKQIGLFNTLFKICAILTTTQVSTLREEYYYTVHQGQAKQCLSKQ